MKNEIKSKESQERQGYVPASMEVIDISAQGVICTSGDPFGGIGDMERTDGTW